MNILRLYTDGACSNNQGDENLGGWGCILEFNGKTKELYGGLANTTNNVMELTAVIEGLNTIKRDGLIIEIFSDSSYVVNCFQKKWYISWLKNGWKNSKKEPVKNKELISSIINYLSKHDISFYHVKGHQNLDSPLTNVDKAYKSFLSKNNITLSIDEFRHINKMNHLADSLANKGIDELREPV